jgi:4-amino-4-deoxy-L-arabinose transferase-like glycosyltransferase
MLLGVWLAAAALRLVHNEVMLADPLYFNPLGGNLPYLLAAEAISGGDLVPFDGPLSLNSPLYPYFLAGLYQLLGENAFYGIRVVTGLMDAGTCAMVSLLAWRHFGAIAGWAAGLVTAVYGPLVFFAADLNPVPLTLFLLTAALVVVDRARRPRGFLAAGLLFGLTAATRPNVLLAGLAALTVPWLRRSPAPSRAALALAAGLAMGVAPVTLVNVAASGELVLLTTSAGHNFYIGHNPQAEAQYVLPSGFDGDIFASMKVLAEEVEGRPFEDREVSSWYFRRGLAHVAENPGRELALLGRRSLLLVNDFEATTYASFDYQRHYSGVLRWTPSFLLLFALAIPGMSIAMRRERLHLWIPLATAAATVLLFFYIARLRVVMVPSLGVFAGAGVAILTAAVRDGRWRRLLSLTGAALVGAGVAALPILQSDTSNEWAKAGGVLRVAGNLDGAEAAFVKGVAENPDNANIWLSLASLYRAEGRTAAADSAQARADALLEAGDRDADTYRRALEAAP